MKRRRQLMSAASGRIFGLACIYLLYVKFFCCKSEDLSELVVQQSGVPLGEATLFTAINCHGRKPPSWLSDCVRARRCIHQIFGNVGGKNVVAYPAHIGKGYENFGHRDCNFNNFKCNGR